MIGEITQIVARNNNDSSAATNERLAEALERLAEASTHPASHANTSTEQQLPISDAHWNSKELPDTVGKRFDLRDTYLSKEQMETFEIENKDENGVVISTAEVNHYLHIERGTNIQKLITQNGDCYDLTPQDDNKK